jgi:hypothetical protein
MSMILREVVAHSCPCNRARGSWRRAAPAQGSDALDAAQAAASSSLALGFDPSGHLGVGGAAVRRVVLEAAAVGWIVRGRDDDAVGKPGSCAPRLYVRMACEMAGVGVYSSSAAVITSTPFAASTSIALANAGADSACVSKPMNSGPSMSRAACGIADRLGDREYVKFVETRSNEDAAVAGGAEGHALGGDAGVRAFAVVRGDQPRNIHQRSPPAQAVRRAD